MYVYVSQCNVPGTTHKHTRILNLLWIRSVYSAVAGIFLEMLLDGIRKVQPRDHEVGPTADDDDEDEELLLLVSSSNPLTLIYNCRSILSF